MLGRKMENEVSTFTLASFSSSDQEKSVDLQGEHGGGGFICVPVSFVNHIAAGADGTAELQATSQSQLLNQTSIVSTQPTTLLSIQVENIHQQLTGGSSEDSGVSTASAQLLDGQQDQINQPTNEEPKKRKGGWPKGKKRKKETRDSNAPKAPVTGYVLYLTEQREKLKVEHPELPFTEMTRLLGSRWSALSQEDKQKYLDAAEVDKRRYIEELKAYQQSEAYQSWLKRQAAKKLKCLVDVETIDGEVDSIVLDLEDDPSDLYCKTCNQYFSSLHNKKEHMYGKQHLQMLTGEFEREAELTKQEEDRLLSTSVDEPECLDRTAFLERYKGPNSTENMKMDIIEANTLREMEIGELRRSLEISRERHLQLQKQAQVYKLRLQKVESEVENMKAYGASLATQLDGLRMVPTLFGVINF
ncbi:high mobility group protein 20A-like isoform X2 [Branchiostoma lanceolatum]|uniref:high mobility group protein 20A-like isoform X2 n=1 Tax=Branchiostoma lanceolatum TaxID=7740 RepID=UPI00345324A8